MVPVVELTLERRAQVHAALSDPVRLGIVDELALSDRAPGELAERFGVRSNLLAHHLDVLEDAGLIERLISHGDRRRRYVRLVADGLRSLLTAPVLHAAGVVFVCTRNSARSQLAAAVWNSHSAIEAISAGTDPADHVHPEAVRAARRHQLDLAGATPTLVDLDALGDRLVVTVCDLAHEELATLAASRRRDDPPLLHWSIPDPADAASGRAFDEVVDILDTWVASLAPLVHPT